MIEFLIFGGLLAAIGYLLYIGITERSMWP